MINGIKKIAMLAAVVALFACAGDGNDDTSDTNTGESPGPVSESDRSRYNLNAADEMVQEMQDSTEIDTVDSLEETPDIR